ncbi:hypothetical protein K439DRAFT_1613167 [Ramaria rubella]|nr:hypothetical protein K439DRAFT_1613167 [Ramaria rubella]
MKSWPEYRPMASITQYALDRYNEVWTKTMDYLLQPCDIQLRWHGNHTILENSAEKLLSEFYQQHWEDRDHAMFFTIPNKYKSYTKGQGFILTVLFDFKFEIHTESEAMVKSRGSKASKIAGEIPTSSFVPRPKAGLHQFVIPVTSMVTLQWANAQYVEALDSVEIHVDHSNPICEGQLGNEAWETGGTKKVYKLTVGDEHYVAKQMFEIGNGAEE